MKTYQKKLDDQLDFKKLIGGLLGQGIEWFDRKIIHGGLTYGISKVPEEYHPDLEVVFNAYLNDDLASLSEVVKTRMNEVINIPGLDEEDEAILFGALGTAVFTILNKKIQNG